MESKEEELIYGFNSIMNAIEGKRKPTKVFISDNHSSNKVIEACKKYNVAYQVVDKRKIEQMARGKNHQGCVALIPSFRYDTLTSLLKKINEKNSALLLILDGIEDPNNFGSLIRTSSCLGIDGIIISKSHQVQVTPTVTKVSTGGEEHISIARVSNITQAINELKKHGFWIVASDGHGESFYDEIDYSGKTAIIIGSEGKGISSLVLKNSDFIAKIPMEGRITSLNAAVAGAIFLAQAISYRSKKK
ncbi:MAG TPA: 23S rRNA (guanosine(2251)-2'-O)-methyltransferase RlmB [Firmicutes bacterium]|nr:23S rRNA (guanosine(2251)-2'-O)-methyltransferase RlmB [Bacillota bacterium]